jgi:tetratricopeptide (TPR) repeat protein
MSETSPAEEVFFTALEKPTPADRAAYLDAACAGNPDLRAKVERLLAAHPRVGRFLEPAASPAATTIEAGGPDATASFDPEASPDPAASPAGAAVAGRYKLLARIGEGGMGSVWLADQTDPVRRRVAVKLVRADRASSQAILSRFEAERQAIALMDHPNIARLLDAGTTDDGRPFFVMELVEGVPLTDYCDEHRLTVPERLRLFVQVCGAVQHAHQKGVIHRDLKPTNILVDSHDATPVPKVIDFGLAKAATGLQLTEHTLSTGFGSVLGTPLYMAPEQARFDAVDVDTRADVYALGVILYELLTGTTPLTRAAVRTAQLDEMLRLIREQEPPTPSSRLNSSDARPGVATNRQTEAAKLGRSVRGELDWIVLKALAKDRDQRYGTANGFARDVERFLNHEPVTAGPPGRAYRLRKFVRRNRPQVIAVSLVLLALVAGVIGTTLGLVQANAKRQEAERNLAFARKGNEILGSVFAGLDPKQIAESGRPLQDVLRENLTTAVRELEGSAIGEPLEVAAMQLTLGRSLVGLGESPRAAEVLQKAMDTRTARLGPDHPDTLRTMNDLALAYRLSGQFPKALPLLEEAVERMKARLGPDHPDTLRTMNNLALAYRLSGRLARAVGLFEETLGKQKAIHGPDDPDTLTSMSDLALAYQDDAKLDLAVPLAEDALKLRKARLGPDHPTTLTSMHNLAFAYQAAGMLHRALPLAEDALKLRKARLGADHPDTLISMGNLAGAYQRTGQLDRALPLYEEALRLLKARLGADHPLTLTGMGNLGWGYQAAGQLDKAVPLYEETLKLQKARLGADHLQALITMNNLAIAYQAAGQLDKAVPLYEETLKKTEAKHAPDHPRTLQSMGSLAIAYQAAGQFDKAVPLYEKTLEKAKATLAPDDPFILTIMGNLGTAYAQAKQSEKAAATLAAFADGMRNQVPKDSPQFAGVLAQVSLELLECGQPTAAELLLRECLAIREKTQPDVWTTFNTRSMLGEALLGQKKYAAAEPLLLEGYDGMKAREKAIPPQASARIPEALERLIEFYTVTDQPDEVKKWRTECAKYPFVAPMPRPTK